MKHKKQHRDLKDKAQGQPWDCTCVALGCKKAAKTKQRQHKGGTGRAQREHRTSREAAQMQ